jgi:hypothetical protein
MFRRDDAVAVGGYRTYQNTGQDVDFILRLVEAKGSGACLMEPLYWVRKHAESVSVSPETVLRSRVPRQLAEERRASGGDRVMRGVPIVLTVDDAARQAAVGLKMHDALKYAGFCLATGDYRGAIPFLKQVLTGGLFRVTALAGLLRLVYLWLRGLLARNT